MNLPGKGVIRWNPALPEAKLESMLVFCIDPKHEQRVDESTVSLGFPRYPGSCSHPTKGSQSKANAQVGIHRPCFIGGLEQTSAGGLLVVGCFQHVWDLLAFQTQPKGTHHFFRSLAFGVAAGVWFLVSLVGRGSLRWLVSSSQTSALGRRPGIVRLMSDGQTENRVDEGKQGTAPLATNRSRSPACIFFT